jgi:hypothetical protein
LVEVD